MCLSKRLGNKELEGIELKSKGTPERRSSRETDKIKPRVHRM